MVGGLDKYCSVQLRIAFDKWSQDESGRPVVCFSVVGTLIRDLPANKKLRAWLPSVEQLQDQLQAADIQIDGAGQAPLDFPVFISLFEHFCNRANTNRTETGTIKSDKMITNGEDFSLGTRRNNDAEALNDASLMTSFQSTEREFEKEVINKQKKRIEEHNKKQKNQEKEVQKREIYEQMVMSENEGFSLEPGSSSQSKVEFQNNKIGEIERKSLGKVEEEDEEKEEEEQQHRQQKQTKPQQHQHHHHHQQQQQQQRQQHKAAAAAAEEEEEEEEEEEAEEAEEAEEEEEDKNFRLNSNKNPKNEKRGVLVRTPSTQLANEIVEQKRERWGDETNQPILAGKHSNNSTDLLTGDDLLYDDFDLKEDVTDFNVDTTYDFESKPTRGTNINTSWDSQQLMRRRGSLESIAEDQDSEQDSDLDLDLDLEEQHENVRDSGEQREHSREHANSQSDHESDHESDLEKEKNDNANELPPPSLGEAEHDVETCMYDSLTNLNIAEVPEEDFEAEFEDVDLGGAHASKTDVNKINTGTKPLSSTSKLSVGGKSSAVDSFSAVSSDDDEEEEQHEEDDDSEHTEMRSFGSGGESDSNDDIITDDISNADIRITRPILKGPLKKIYGENIEGTQDQNEANVSESIRSNDSGFPDDEEDSDKNTETENQSSIHLDQKRTKFAAKVTILGGKGQQNEQPEKPQVVVSISNKNNDTSSDKSSDGSFEDGFSDDSDIDKEYHKHDRKGDIKEENEQIGSQSLNDFILQSNELNDSKLLLKKAKFLLKECREENEILNEKLISARIDLNDSEARVLRRDKEIAKLKEIVTWTEIEAEKAAALAATEQLAIVKKYHGIGMKHRHLKSTESYGSITDSSSEKSRSSFDSSNRNNNKQNGRLFQKHTRPNEVNGKYSRRSSLGSNTQVSSTVKSRRHSTSLARPNDTFSYPLFSSPRNMSLVHLGSVVRISNIELNVPQALLASFPTKLYCMFMLGVQHKRTSLFNISRNKKEFDVLYWNDELDLHLEAGDSLLQPVAVLVKGKKKMLKDTVLGMIQLDISVGNAEHINNKYEANNSESDRVVHECEAPMVATSKAGGGESAFMRCHLEFIPDS